MPSITEALPDHQAVRAAAQRIAGQVLRTPVLFSERLDRLAGARLHFKCENLQIGGAFKLRGAVHAVSRLPAGCRAVCTHSSGNHGAALALAAGRRGLKCTVVVPEGASGRKLQNMQQAGAEIVRCAPTQAAREDGVTAVQQRTGATLIPPYDHPDVIAGQGTAALELIDSVPDLDCLIAPVGGGGLLAGTALAADGQIEVRGAEPAGADDTARSLQAGTRLTDRQPDTCCDGLRAFVGVMNFAIIRHHVACVHTVDDSAVIAAMRLIWDELKLVVEPSAAIVLAAVLGAPADFAGRRVGLVLSGGNVDLGRLPW